MDDDIVTVYGAKEIEDFECRELREYLETVGDITAEEKKGLRKWIAAGYSVYDNPYSLYYGSGFPMDYIEGVRTGNDMMKHPEDYFGGESLESESKLVTEDDVPF